MTGVSRSYSETSDRAKLQALFYRWQLANATAESEIEHELPDVPSLSMEERVAKYGHQRIVRLWLPLEGREWAGLYTGTLPQEISQSLQRLCEEQSEEGLYEIADAIAKWIAQASRAEQTVFTTHIHELPDKAAHVLLAALADAEVRIASEWLLHAIAGFLPSDDKLLSQAAAVCLLTCGDAFGRALLQDKLKDAASLPHAQLIRGVVNLLAIE